MADGIGFLKVLVAAYKAPYHLSYLTMPDRSARPSSPITSIYFIEVLTWQCAGEQGETNSSRFVIQEKKALAILQTSSSSELAAGCFVLQEKVIVC